MEPTPFESAALQAAAVAHRGLAATRTRWRSTTDPIERGLLEDLDRVATDLMGRWALVVDEAWDLEPIGPAESIAALSAAARGADTALASAWADDDEWEPEPTKYVAAFRHYVEQLERHGREHA